MLSKAAAIGDNLTKEEVYEGLFCGTFKLFLRDNSAALASHGNGFLRIGLAGGNMEDMHSIEKEAVRYAKSFNYKYVEIVGRPGWERALLDYKRVAVVLQKEL